MKVNIVCHGDVNSWILGKFVGKLEEYLPRYGATVLVGERVNIKAEINHHIVHYEPLEIISGVQTQMVTHIDSIHKLNVLKKQLNIASMGICMSSDTVRKLYLSGIPNEKLCFINPAQDSVIKPRLKRIGVTCRVQDDGRKREWFLGDLGTYLDPQIFEFIIMGDGWERQVNKLFLKGFKIKFYPEFEYNEYVKIIPTLDYYLYFGEDEGQMGFIDALAAGVETIVTPQGYHLDVKDGITYSYNSFNELVEIFSNITKKLKNNYSKVSDWTWANYAKKHVDVWRYLLEMHHALPNKTISKNNIEKFSTLCIKNSSEIKCEKNQKNTLFFNLYTGYLKQKLHILLHKIKKIDFLIQAKLIKK